MGLTSGIIVLIALIVPVTLSIIDGVLVGSWLWGLVWGTYGGVSMSIMAYDPIGITCTLIILVAGILTLSTVKAAKNRGNSLNLGILWVLCGVSVIASSIFYLIMQFDLFMISDFNIGLYLFSFSGFFLLISGAVLTKERTFDPGEAREEGYVPTERTFHQKKYRCMRCGHKTAKLAFQPTECPECGGSVLQVL